MWSYSLFVQSEVSPKDKYKYHILVHIYGMKRWHWWIYFQGNNGKTDIEDRPMDTVGGEEGDGELFGESNIEIYNILCKIDSQ